MQQNQKQYGMRPQEQQLMGQQMMQGGMVNKSLRQLTANQHSATGPKVQQMRMVGHVPQKDLDKPEATPIVQDKTSTGIAGLS
jgi:hypothetical protein